MKGELKLQKTWRLGPQIGGGGFGRVYEAEADGIAAAAKFVPKAPGADREMLFAELADVRNVVPVIDSGETDDDWVLVMPRADRSLRDQMNSAPLDLTSTLAVLQDICVALADLDGRVVHRDLKPENVLLLDSAWCLADFGISRYAEATTAPDTQKFALTPAYAAPERWRAERATSASDVYAVGVMAYEMLAGTLPFGGPDHPAFREQHLHSDAARLSGFNSALAALVDECLYKAPGARPGAANVLARLERVQNLPSSPGLARLRDANSVHVEEQAMAARVQSVDQTEAERRSGLEDAARRSFAIITDELREVILEAASAARANSSKRRDGWSLELGAAKLSVSEARSTPQSPWQWDAPAFDVIAHARISVAIPQTRYDYTGRSHSLWFCDAFTEGEYQWFETAFMTSPLMPTSRNEAPFALDPGEAAAKALWNGMAEYQMAWPFVPLTVGELEEFIDRWASWFATAAEGAMQHPSTLPERQPTNSFRRS